MVGVILALALQTGTDVFELLVVGLLLAFQLRRVRLRQRRQLALQFSNTHKYAASEAALVSLFAGALFTILP